MLLESCLVPNFFVAKLTSELFVYCRLMFVQLFFCSDEHFAAGTSEPSLANFGHVMRIAVDVEATCSNERCFWTKMTFYFVLYFVPCKFVPIHSVMWKVKTAYFAQLPLV
jgi:hypothetical protein